MPRHASRPDALLLAGFVALAVLSGPGPAAAAMPAAALDGSGREEDAASLALARDRDVQAAAAVDGLKLALRPGHLADPMPDLDRSYGLETLRDDLSEMQRKAAGYRATLGSQHPTLAAADQTLADLRGQLLDATRKALANAERDAAAAHAALADAERDAVAARAPRRAADAAVSIAPPAVPAPSAALAPARRPTARSAGDRAVSDAAAEGGASGARRPGASPWTLAAAAASGLLALLSAAWAARRLLRSFRRPPRSRFTVQRREPALAPLAAGPPREPVVAVPAAPVPAHTAGEPAPRPARRGPIDDLAALASLPLPRSAAAADLVATMTGDPGGPLAAAAAGLHAAALARVPGAAGRRVTLLVTGVGDAREGEADLVALALAHAAASAGGRVAVMEARRAGRLRRTSVPAGAHPAVVEAGGAARTLYRVDTPAGILAVLPCDASEAEAVRRPGAARLRGLDAFDLVVLVGEDVSTLVQGADFVVVAGAPSGSEAEVAAATRLCRAAGCPCGGVVVARPDPPVPVPMQVPMQVPVPAPVPVPGPMPGAAASTARRRIAVPQPARSTGRLGLRGTLEPLRQGGR